MNTHQGYDTKAGEAKCTNCGEWIENEDNAVLMLPSTVGDSGVETDARAIHAVVCMGCYEEL